MRRYILMVVGWLVVFSGAACSFDNTPKRLSSYLAPLSSAGAPERSLAVAPVEPVTAALLVINDYGFEKSAPALEPETLHHLGAYLQAEIQQQLPIHLSSIVYPERWQPTGSAERFVRVAHEQGVPYLLMAILSSSEWEVPDRLPLNGFQQPTGLRSGGLLGYRAENYARLELALLDGQTGQPVLTTDGQAWAVLERLAVPLESNVYPVVRRDLTQPPIFPNTEGDAFETLRWASGQDAIAQAVMHLEEVWKMVKAS